MAPRGRKPKLKNRVTTCVSIESADLEFMKGYDKELSEFLRESIAAFRKSKSSPIEQLKKDIEETKNKIKEYEIILHQREMQLIELEENEELLAQEEREREEFEDKRRVYITGCIKSMQSKSTYNRLWMEHLMEAWKFSTFDEAKEYVMNVWINEGVPEKKVKSYLRLN